MYSGNMNELENIMIYNNVEECLAIREYCETASDDYTLDVVGDMVVDDWRYMTQALERSRADGLINASELHYLRVYLDVLAKYTMRSLLNSGVHICNIPEDLSEYTVEDVFGIYWAYMDFVTETGYFGLV